MKVKNNIQQWNCGLPEDPTSCWRYT